MDIEYKWSITGLDKLDVMKVGEANEELKDVVTSVRFVYTGTIDTGDNKGLQAHFSGVCPLNVPDTKNFVAYSDLKESDLLDEIKKLHPGTHMNSTIEKALEQKINPVVAVDVLPWNEETTE
tara:strand:+ start:11948 stop:12313 length:366 start_codon:yes stop_codon:yes gene_type:complete